MRVIIEIDIDTVAFDEPGELRRILNLVPEKVDRIVARAPGCICTIPEADDLLKDAFGNTVGTVEVTRRERRPVTTIVMRPEEVMPRSPRPEAPKPRHDIGFGECDCEVCAPSDDPCPMG
jgi:hypothetical protein